MSDTYGNFTYQLITSLTPPACLNGKLALEKTALGFATAIKLLQNFTAIAYMNPLVISCVHLAANDPNAVDYKAVAAEFQVPLHPLYATSDFSKGQWAITDQLTDTYQLTYHVAERNTIDGMESLTDAGSGTHIYGRWKVAPTVGQPGVISLNETSTTRALTDTLAYIQSTTASSHESLHASFKATWEQMVCAECNALHGHCS